MASEQPPKPDLTLAEQEELQRQTRADREFDDVDLSTVNYQGIMDPNSGMAADVIQQFFLECGQKSTDMRVLKRQVDDLVGKLIPEGVNPSKIRQDPGIEYNVSGVKQKLQMINMSVQNNGNVTPLMRKQMRDSFNELFTSVKEQVTKQKSRSRSYDEMVPPPDKRRRELQVEQAGLEQRRDELFGAMLEAAEDIYDRYAGPKRTIVGSIELKIAARDFIWEMVNLERRTELLDRDGIERVANHAMTDTPGNATLNKLWKKELLSAFDLVRKVAKEKGANQAYRQAKKFLQLQTAGNRQKWLIPLVQEANKRKSKRSSSAKKTKKPKKQIREVQTPQVKKSFKVPKLKPTLRITRRKKPVKPPPEPKEVAERRLEETNAAALYQGLKDRLNVPFNLETYQFIQTLEPVETLSNLKIKDFPVGKQRVSVAAFIQKLVQRVDEFEKAARMRKQTESKLEQDAQNFFDSYIMQAFSGAVDDLVADSLEDNLYIFDYKKYPGLKVKYKGQRVNLKNAVETALSNVINWEPDDLPKPPPERKPKPPEKKPKPPEKPSSPSDDTEEYEDADVDLVDLTDEPDEKQQPEEKADPAFAVPAKPVYATHPKWKPGLRPVSQGVRSFKTKDKKETKWYATIKWNEGKKTIPGSQMRSFPFSKKEDAEQFQHWLRNKYNDVNMAELPADVRQYLLPIVIGSERSANQAVYWKYFEPYKGLKPPKDLYDYNPIHRLTRKSEDELAKSTARKRRRRRRSLLESIKSVGATWKEVPESVLEHIRKHNMHWSEDNKRGYTSSMGKSKTPNKEETENLMNLTSYVLADADLWKDKRDLKKADVLKIVLGALDEFGLSKKYFTGNGWRSLTDKVSKVIAAVEQNFSAANRKASVNYIRYLQSRNLDEIRSSSKQRGHSVSTDQFDTGRVETQAEKDALDALFSRFGQAGRATAEAMRTDESVVPPASAEIDVDPPSDAESALTGFTGLSELERQRERSKSREPESEQEDVLPEETELPPAQQDEKIDIEVYKQAAKTHYETTMKRWKELETEVAKKGPDMDARLELWKRSVQAMDNFRHELDRYDLDLRELLSDENYRAYMDMSDSRRASVFKQEKRQWNMAFIELRQGSRRKRTTVSAPDPPEFDVENPIILDINDINKRYYIELQPPDTLVFKDRDRLLKGERFSNVLNRSKDGYLMLKAVVKTGKTEAGTAKAWKDFKRKHRLWAEEAADLLGIERTYWDDLLYDCFVCLESMGKYTSKREKNLQRYNALRRIVKLDDWVNGSKKMTPEQIEQERAFVLQHVSRINAQKHSSAYYGFLKQLARRNKYSWSDMLGVPVDRLDDEELETGSVSSASTVKTVDSGIAPIVPPQLVTPAPKRKKTIRNVVVVDGGGSGLSMPTIATDQAVRIPVAKIGKQIWQNIRMNSVPQAQQDEYMREQLSMHRVYMYGSKTKLPPQAFNTFPYKTSRVAIDDKDTGKMFEGFVRSAQQRDPLSRMTGKRSHIGNYVSILATPQRYHIVVYKDVPPRALKKLCMEIKKHVKSLHYNAHVELFREVGHEYKLVLSADRLRQIGLGRLARVLIEYVSKRRKGHYVHFVLLQTIPGGSLHSYRGIM